MSEEAKRHFVATALKTNTGFENARTISEIREAVDKFYRPIVDRARERYPVNIEDRKIGGVSTQVITPKKGVSPGNQRRILINLHGGGFTVGAGLGGLAESIPVAAVERIKVVSVDYRMAPEYHFPAASQDVAAVYAELLKQYGPENVGIYGGSAGGVLTAMAVAWIEKEGLPLPGAVGIFAAGAYGNPGGSPEAPNTWGGDSKFLAPILAGQPPLSVKGMRTVAGEMNYTGNLDNADPLASPALSAQLLSKFPPTLLIAGTRGAEMSAAVQTHRLLTKSGTRASLHLWDGMGHDFLLYVDFPEAQEAYDVIARFFDANLGRGAN